MRIEYEMTEAQEMALLDTCRTVIPSENATQKKDRLAREAALKAKLEKLESKP